MSESVITVRNIRDPLVAVMIITKNESKFISGWFDQMDKQSIRGQIEIIACDASNDGTERIVGSRADVVAFCSDCRFAAARNECARLAKAPILLFTDVDIGYPSPTFISDSLRYFQRNGIKMAGITGIRQIDGRIVHKLTGQFIMIDRAVFEKIGGFGRFLGVWNTWEDVDLMLKAQFYRYKIESVPGIISHLRPEKKWMIVT